MLTRMSTTTPFVHGFADHCLDLREVGNVGAVTGCFAARRADLGDDAIGVGRSPVFVTEIVDDDFGAALGQCQCVTASESLASAGDDGHLAVESDTHVFASSPGVRGSATTIIDNISATSAGVSSPSISTVDRVFDQPLPGFLLADVENLLVRANARCPRARASGSAPCQSRS